MVIINIMHRNAYLIEMYSGFALLSFSKPIISINEMKRRRKMNSINIIGRLTRDPEVKKTEDGRTICTFSVAVDDIFSKDERTDFFRIAVFGPQGDLCEKFLRKGFLAGVTGRLRNESYVDAEGKTRYSLNIIADNVRFLQWPERDESEVKVG